MNDIMKKSYEKIVDKLSTTIVSYILIIIGIFISNIKINSDEIIIFSSKLPMSINKSSINNAVLMIGLVFIFKGMLGFVDKLRKLIGQNNMKNQIQKDINISENNEQFYGKNNLTGYIFSRGLSKHYQYIYTVSELVCINDKCISPLKIEFTYLYNYKYICPYCDFKFKSKYNYFTLTRIIENQINTAERIKSPSYKDIF